MDEMSNLPKYIKLKKEITSLINQGEIKPGDKLPTEHELSEEFGVSRHTVRKAMNILLNEGLLSRKPGVGTFLNQKSKKPTKNIGYVTLNIHDYIFSSIFQGIDNILHSYGYQVLLGSTQNDPQRERVILEEFIRKNVDGLIIEPAQSAINYPNIALLERFVDNHIPVVILDSRFENDKFHYVGVDDLKGGYLATRALLDLGHKQIALIYKRVHLPLINRFKGYKKALEENGIPIYLNYVKECIHTEFEDMKAFETELDKLTRELMSLDNPPTAIFCINDEFAVRVKEILEKIGFDVPQDVSLIGFDDSNLVKLNNISISSVTHPKDIAGRKAAKIILDCLDEGLMGVQENVVFTPEVILRDSVRGLD